MMFSYTCFKLLLLITYCSAVHSLCSFPCEVQAGEQYTSKFGTFEFSCRNSSLLIRTKGKKVEIQECYERSGPFTVLRRKGIEYQCVKEAHMQGKITWVYETPFLKYDFPPTMCSICSPKLMRPVPYVVPGVDLKCLKKLKPPPLGCNIPRNCPVLDYKDVPCSGCEQVDDGSCCMACSTPEEQVAVAAFASASVSANGLDPFFSPFMPPFHGPMTPAMHGPMMPPPPHMYGPHWKK